MSLLSSLGVKAISHHQSSWANTQAAWRFLDNDSVSFVQLSLPLVQAAQQELAARASIKITVTCRICVFS